MVARLETGQFFSSFSSNLITSISFLVHTRLDNFLVATTCHIFQEIHYDSKFTIPKGNLLKSNKGWVCRISLSHLRDKAREIVKMGCP